MNRTKEKHAKLVNQNIEESVQLTDDNTNSRCPQCQSWTDSNDLYCSECGVALQQSECCPKCHSSVFPNADICESCGEWLLKGQCMYCYAKIDDLQKYCGECGNPTAGIICPNCEETSIFDFCTTCNTPLSLEANNMQKEGVQSPDDVDICSLFSNLNQLGDRQFKDFRSSKNSTDQIPEVVDNHALQLKAYRNNSLSENQVSQISRSVEPLFSKEKKQNISQLNEKISKEIERQRVEEEKVRKAAEEKRRREEKERLAEKKRLQDELNGALQKMGNKKFSSNQEARKYFMNIIASVKKDLAEEFINNNIRWRCNAYNNIHQSPNDCADPSKGGVWIL